MGDRLPASADEVVLLLFSVWESEGGEKDEHHGSTAPTSDYLHPGAAADASPGTRAHTQEEELACRSITCCLGRPAQVRATSRCLLQRSRRARVAAMAVRRPRVPPAAAS